MVKGCQKNVIYLKNTGSEMFDEAYFIVSERAKTKNKSENDILREANRIVAGSPICSHFPSSKRSEVKKTGGVKCVAWFMLGACVMTAFNAIVFLII